ncbi:MAG: ABC transporter permease subunit, partial [Rhizobium sp.]
SGQWITAVISALTLLAARALLALPLATRNPSGWVVPFIVSIAIYLLVVWRGLDANHADFLRKLATDRAVSLGVGGFIDKVISWCQVNFQAAFTGIVIVTRTIIDGIEGALGWLPIPVPALALLFAAWRFAGKGVFALTLLAIAYLVFFGFWSQTVSTIALVGASVFITILVGIPVGILLARSSVARRFAEPLLDVMQTLPSFVYLIPAVAFFSVGKTPALVATVVFATPPMIRLTALGIREVSHTAVEAAYAHGANAWQVLTKVELPLALPSLMLGVNQAIVMSLSMVVVSALIGAGGLGYDVVTALRNIQGGAGFLAGLAIVFCALVPDRIIQRAMRKNRRYLKN